MDVTIFYQFSDLGSPHIKETSSVLIISSLCLLKSKFKSWTPFLKVIHIQPSPTKSLSKIQ